MRTRATIVTAMLLLAETGYLRAQRVEVQPFIGYRFGGGFTVDQTTPEGPRPIDLNIESGYAWGATVGILFADVWEAEFMWSRQDSELSAETIGFPKTNLFNMNVNQFHGNVLIHIADSDSSLIPYVLFGLGTTVFDPDVESLKSLTKFSYGLGLGIKAYFTEHAGIRTQFRFTPTYIATTPGLFCDLYCYVVDVADFANQWEFTAGASLRF
jgi:Outer membrane protein beta-barrel domain